MGEGGLLLVVALATMLAPLNSTMIAVALPGIAADFGGGIGESSWLVVGYLVAMAAVQPVGGALGDRLGRRRIVLGALGASIVASVGAALAPSFATLIALRLGQALAGALAIPNAAALVREHVPAARRGAAYGVVGGAAGLAAGLGPPLGGALVSLAGWRLIFAAGTLLGAAALLFAARTLARDAGAVRPGRFDLLGSALLAGWLAAFVLAAGSLRASADALGALRSLALALAALGLAAGFIRRELHAERPVVRLDLLREPTFAAAALAVALGNLAMYCTLLAIPQFLALVERRSSAEVGAVLAALSVPMALLAPFAGRLADALGRRRVALAGCGLTLVGLAPLLGLGPGWPAWSLAGPLLLAGCGLALQAPAVQAAAIEAAPVEHAGMASGVFSTSRYLGSIVGSAALAALLGAGAAPSPTAFLAVFALVEAAALGALVAAGCLRDA